MKLETWKLRALTVTGGARLVAVASDRERDAQGWRPPLLASASSVLSRRFSRCRDSSCMFAGVQFTI